MSIFWQQRADLFTCTYNTMLDFRRDSTRSATTCTTNATTGMYFLWCYTYLLLQPQKDLQSLKMTVWRDFFSFLMELYLELWICSPSNKMGKTLVALKSLHAKWKINLHECPKVTHLVNTLIAPWWWAALLLFNHF